MTSVSRNPTQLRVANCRQHWTAILIKKHIRPDSVTNHFQTDLFCLYRSRIRTIVEAFDCGIVHEVQFDVPHVPLMGERAIGFTKICLCPRIGGIEYEQCVMAALDITYLNRVSFQIMNQPVRMLLVDPSPSGDTKWSGPDSKPQAFLRDLVSKPPDPVREESGIRREVFPICIGIPFVNMKIIKAV